MKKILSVTLVAVLLIATLIAALPNVSAVSFNFGKSGDDNSGSCGASLTWNYDSSSKTITISGTGDMYDYDSANSRPWYEKRNVTSAVRVEEGVTGIGNNAFTGFSTLTSISLPSGLVRLGANAFSACKALTAVSIPGSVDTIGESAFSSCAALREVDIQDGVRVIGVRAFSADTALTSITLPSSVETISGYAFAGDANLANVSLSEGLKNIEQQAFATCPKLASIVLPDSLESLGDSAFRKCSSLSSIVIPGNVTTMGSGIFSDCSALSEVTFAQGARQVGTQMFEDCTSLETVDLGSVERINERAFYNCGALHDLTIPSSVTVLGRDAFTGCAELGGSSLNFEDVNNIREFSYSDIWNLADQWKEHIISISKGTFKLFDTSYDHYNGNDIDFTGFSSNSGSNDGDSLTWIDKSARWTNEDKTEAELRIDFSYLTSNIPTDVLFVLDYSESMQRNVDDIAKIYTLTSKVDDIADRLLNTPGLDNRIAIVPFSEQYPTHLDFTSNYEDVNEYLFNSATTGDTHYSEGFATAYDLITSRNDKARDVIVIFLTDGEPNTGYEGGAESNSIKAMGITIAGILLDTPEASYNKVSSICTKGMTYLANSNEELNDAINSALITSFVSYLVLDNINTENFTIKDPNAITVVDENGKHYDDTVTVSSDLKSIAWDVSAYEPAMNYTLIIPLIVNQNIYGTSLTTNDGDAIIVDKNTHEEVNGVSSPQMNNVSSYTVTYHSNTANDETDVYTFNSGDTVTVINNKFTNSGFGFVSWNTKPDGSGTTYNIGDTFIMQSENVALYAQWSSNSYSLVYEINNGTSGSDGMRNDGSHAYNSQVTVKDNMFTNSGYTFTTWNTKADGTGTSYKAGDKFSMPASDVTLYAQWTAADYKLVYDANAEKYGVSLDYVTRTAKYDTTVDVEENMFDVKGYSFAGWNTKADGTGKTFMPGETFKMPAQNVVLYALWTANNYKLIYDGNGGLTSEKEESVAYRTEFGKTYSVAENMFDHEGYVFSSWNTEKDGSGTTYVEKSEIKMGAYDITLYAQWEKKEAPKTGAENNNIVLYVILLSALAVVVTLTVAKKAVKNEI